MLLELKRAGAGHRLEILMQSRCAHARLRRQGVDAERRAEIAPDPADRPVHILQPAFGARDLAHARGLIAPQQPIQDFPFGEGREDRDVARRSQQP